MYSLKLFLILPFNIIIILRQNMCSLLKCIFFGKINHYIKQVVIQYVDLIVKNDKQFQMQKEQYLVDLYQIICPLLGIYSVWTLYILKAELKQIANLQQQKKSHLCLILKTLQNIKDEQNLQQSVEYQNKCKIQKLFKTIKYMLLNFSCIGIFRKKGFLNKIVSTFELALLLMVSYFFPDKYYLFLICNIIRISQIFYRIYLLIKQVDLLITQQKRLQKIEIQTNLKNQKADDFPETQITKVICIFGIYLIFASICTSFGLFYKNYVNSLIFQVCITFGINTGLSLICNIFIIILSSILIHKFKMLQIICKLDKIICKNQLKIKNEEFCMYIVALRKNQKKMEKKNIGINTITQYKYPEDKQNTYNTLMIENQRDTCFKHNQALVKMKDSIREQSQIQKQNIIHNKDIQFQQNNIIRYINCEQIQIQIDYPSIQQSQQKSTTYKLDSKNQSEQNKSINHNKYASEIKNYQIRKIQLAQNFSYKKQDKYLKQNNIQQAMNIIEEQKSNKLKKSIKPIHITRLGNADSEKQNIENSLTRKTYRQIKKQIKENNFRYKLSHSRSLRRNYRNQ